MSDRMTGYKEAIEVLETKARVEMAMEDAELGAIRAMPFQIAADYLRRVIPIVEQGR